MTKNIQQFNEQPWSGAQEIIEEQFTFTYPPKPEGLNKSFEMVADFQAKMGQPVASKPTVMGEDRRNDRFGYMSEELDEFLFAKTTVDQADAMIDLIYLAVGTLVELGVKPEALFGIVHNANMSKLWPDGKPKLHPETGKVIKPPTFVRPEPLLQAEIERQIKEAAE